MSRLSDSITVLSLQSTRVCASPSELSALPEVAAELRLLDAGDPSARFPLGLRCSACNAWFLWLATRLQCPQDVEEERLDELPAPWEPMRWNFVATVVEAVPCPGCPAVDDYTIIEDPRAALHACLDRLREKDTPEAQHLVRRLRTVTHTTSGSRHRSPLGQALEALQRLGRSRPDATTLLRLATLCQGLRQNSRALKLVTDAFALEPAALEGHYLAAVIHLEQRNWDQAFPALRQTADLRLDGTGVRLYLGSDTLDELVTLSLAELRSRQPERWTAEDARRLSHLAPSDR